MKLTFSTFRALLLIGVASNPEVGKKNLNGSYGYLDYAGWAKEVKSATIALLAELDLIANLYDLEFENDDEEDGKPP